MIVTTVMGSSLAGCGHASKSQRAPVGGPALPCSSTLAVTLPSLTRDRPRPLPLARGREYEAHSLLLPRPRNGGEGRGEGVWRSLYGASPSLQQFATTTPHDSPDHPAVDPARLEGLRSGCLGGNQCRPRGAPASR